MVVTAQLAEQSTEDPKVRGFESSRLFTELRRLDSNPCNCDILLIVPQTVPSSPSKYCHC